MNCMYCGNTIPDNSVFCPFCGKQIPQPTEPAGAADAQYAGAAQPTEPVGADHAPYGGAAQPTEPVGAAYAAYGEAQQTGPAGDYTIFQDPQVSQAYPQYNGAPQQTDPAEGAYPQYGGAPQPMGSEDEADEEYDDAPQDIPSKRGGKKWIAVIPAAVLVILLAVGVWYFWFNPTYTANAKDKCDLSVESVSIYVGESYEFKVDNTITSSDKSILSVDGTKVTGEKPGEVTVKSSVFPFSSTCKVNVMADTIKFKEGDRLELYVGQTLDPEISIGGSTAKKDVTWSSGDTAVATVDANGTVTGVAEGTATITAALPSGEQASCTVEVKPDEVVFDDHSERKISAGETVAIGFTVEGVSEKKDVAWQTSDPAVATVDSEGNVTGVSQGTATITASLPNKTSDTCKVTVKQDEITVIAPESNKVLIGSRVTLDVKLTGETDKREITWSSDDTSVATVDGRGTVTGVAPGTVTVTAKLPNGSTGSCKLTVEPPVVSQRNGFVKRPAGSEVAPVAVHAPSDASCYVYFKSQDRSSNDFSIFVNAGDTTEVKAPIGKYEVYYASGTEWYGPKFKFGAEAEYYRADGVFEFYVSGNTVYGTELTLSDDDGNLKRENVDESDFPG